LIDLQTLAQWRTHAPWADDLMVEQDYLLSQAVERIFRDGKLSRQLAMRGGTVLHKGHLAAALEPLLGKPLESLETTVRLAVRNFASKVRRRVLTRGRQPLLASTEMNRVWALAPAHDHLTGQTPNLSRLALGWDAVEIFIFAKAGNACSGNGFVPLGEQFAANT
jgi:hypothetical protein